MWAIGVICGIGHCRNLGGTAIVTLEGAGTLTLKLGTSSSTVTDWTVPSDKIFTNLELLHWSWR